jgi:hypothetical protein
MKVLSILYSLFSVCVSTVVPKLCKNCKHFIPLRFKADFIINPNYGKCSKFLTFINKEIDYEYVEKVRKTETMCGTEGKYYNSVDKIDNYKILDY